MQPIKHNCGYSSITNLTNGFITHTVILHSKITKTALKRRQITPEVPKSMHLGEISLLGLAKHFFFYVPPPSPSRGSSLRGRCQFSLWVEQSWSLRPYASPSGLLWCNHGWPSAGSRFHRLCSLCTEFHLPRYVLPRFALLIRRCVICRR